VVDHRVLCSEQDRLDIPIPASPASHKECRVLSTKLTIVRVIEGCRGVITYFSENKSHRGEFESICVFFGDTGDNWKS
jgi:hypothetical protein